MSLVILEGMDRSGKSTVADHYKAKGYEYVHQSAPPKGQTADLFLEEQMQLVSSAAHKDVVLDRSYYGELVWPSLYKRESLLTDEGLETLRELEESVDTTRIMMHDPNVDAHWKRCVDNKEPLTRPQFLLARNAFNSMAEKYGFVKKTLNDFAVLPQAEPNVPTGEQDTKLDSAEDSRSPSKRVVPSSEQDLTREQKKLQSANAINAVLSRRILKSFKGSEFDNLEKSIRTFLEAELAQLLGTKTNTLGFTDEEVELLKFFCNHLKKGKQ